MYRLEIPLQFPRCRLKRNQRTSEQIHTSAISAVKIVVRSTERDVHDAAIFVDSHEVAPGVHTGSALPAVPLPSLMTRLARPGHRMKLPEFRTGPRIVGAGIAGQSE